MNIIGVLGGSGLYQLDQLDQIEELSIETPFGSPSDQLIKGVIDDQQVIFLARHGQGHKILPSEINYRANIYALKSLGVTTILSVGAVGSLNAKFAPGSFVLPDQFIDLAHGRTNTFFGAGVVAHPSMAHPTCPLIPPNILSATTGSSLQSAVTIHQGGTYLTIAGPHFSSLAESKLYRSWEADLIGMTAATEAKLAREAEICYQPISIVTDYDCWSQDEDIVSANSAVEVLMEKIPLTRELLVAAIKQLAGHRNCSCQSSLKNALVTDLSTISIVKREQLASILANYL